MLVLLVLTWEYTVSLSRQVSLTCLYYCRVWADVLIRMSVDHYGPSSQTLTFLDPEDDLGSL